MRNELVRHIVVTVTNGKDGGFISSYQLAAGPDYLAVVNNLRSDEVMVLDKPPEKIEAILATAFIALIDNKRD